MLNPVYGCARIESCRAEQKESSAEQEEGSKERMKLFNDVKYKVLCLVVRWAASNLSKL